MFHGICYYPLSEEKEHLAGNMFDFCASPGNKTGPTIAQFWGMSGCTPIAASKRTI